MTIADVEVWLQDKAGDYATGVVLYSVFGSSDFLKGMFATGDDAYNRERLKKELQAVLKTFKPVTIAAQSVPKPSLNVTKSKITVPKRDDFERHTLQNEPVDVSQLPKELQDRFALKGKAFKRSSTLFAQLGFLKTDKERYDAAQAIDEDWQLISKVWDEYHYWKKFGVLKADNGFDVEEAAQHELVTRKATVRTYITKLKKNDPKNKLKDYLNELERIEKRLKEMDDE